MNLLQGEEDGKEGNSDTSTDDESSSASDGNDTDASSLSNSEESENDDGADLEMKLTRQAIEQRAENISEDISTYHDNGLSYCFYAAEYCKCAFIRWPS